jgi:hypothetical protein
MSKLITLGLSQVNAPIQATPACLHPAGSISIGLHPHCKSCGQDVSWSAFYHSKRVMKQTLLQG